MQRELARKSVTRHLSDLNANHVGMGCHRIKITTVSHSCGKDLIMESTQRQEKAISDVIAKISTLIARAICPRNSKQLRTESL